VSDLPPWYVRRGPCLHRVSRVAGRFRPDHQIAFIEWREGSLAPALSS
jgi:hypothetical protein